MNGKALQQLRLDLGLSLNDVARRTGLSSQSIVNLEQGHTANPRLDTLCKLAKAYGVDAIRLLVKEAA